jgi:hypothetical protein
MRPETSSDSKENQQDSEAKSRNKQQRKLGANKIGEDG